MARRRGIFGWVRDLFKANPEPAEPEPVIAESPPITPEPPRTSGGWFGQPSHDERMREIWNKWNDERDSRLPNRPQLRNRYQNWMNIFNEDIPAVPTVLAMTEGKSQQEIDAELEKLWDLFLRGYFPWDSMPKGDPEDKRHPKRGTWQYERKGFIDAYGDDAFEAMSHDEWRTEMEKSTP